MESEDTLHRMHSI